MTGRDRRQLCKVSFPVEMLSRWIRVLVVEAKSTSKVQRFDRWKATARYPADVLGGADHFVKRVSAATVQFEAVELAAGCGEHARQLVEFIELHAGLPRLERINSHIDAGGGVMEEQMTDLVQAAEEEGVAEAGPEIDLIVGNVPRRHDKALE